MGVAIGILLLLSNNMFAKLNNKTAFLLFLLWIFVGSISTSFTPWREIMQIHIIPPNDIFINLDFYRLVWFLILPYAVPLILYFTPGANETKNFAGTQPPSLQLENAASSTELQLSQMHEMLRMAKIMDNNNDDKNNDGELSDIIINEFELKSQVNSKNNNIKSKKASKKGKKEKIMKQANKQR